MRDCRRHCWVWQPEDEDQIAYACAHCDQERHRWVPEDLAGDLERAAASLDAHAVCTRPARLPLFELVSA